MSDIGQDASFFTHRIIVASPEGFGPDTGAAIDRYVLSQFGRRWKDAFARYAPGIYLVRVTDGTESDANSLVMMLSIALFGQMHGCALEPNGEGEAAQSSIKLEPAAAERLSKTLASADIGGGALNAVEAAVRDAKSDVAALRGEFSEIADQIAAKISASSQPAPAPVGDVEDSKKPLFNMARSGAVLFSASMKSMSRRVDQAVDSLTDAVKRIEDAAPGEPIDAPARPAASEGTLRSLAENLAELARGQAEIAEMLKSGGNPASVADDVEEAVDAVETEDEAVVDVAHSADDAGDASIEARIAALSSKIESVGGAVRGLTDKIGEISSEASEDLALVLTQVATVGEDCRASLEQMLDIAVAWRRSVEASERVEDAPATGENADASDAEETDAFAEAISEGEAEEAEAASA